MDKDAVTQYLTEQYGAVPDHPWEAYPTYCVFRHRENQKWFALLMDVPRKHLGLPGTETIDVVNVKCDPLMIGSFLESAGILPAYHMNKAHWLSVLLDGTADDDTVRTLLDISYALTDKKPKRRS